jgi:hypothetical protein
MASRGLSRKQRKEAFLQANFRFVVSDRVGAQRYMQQADQMFEWEDVLQARTICFHFLSRACLLHSCQPPLEVLHAKQCGLIC